MEIDIGINKDMRKEIATGFEVLLADTYTLYLKTHSYHWNVTGPMFQTLHDMFMAQYTETWNAVDIIAERIRILGFMAPGSYSKFAKLTSITEDTEVPAARDMIKNLVLGHETVVRTARSLYPAVEKAGDEASADLLTQRIQIHEKTAWMLRSLIEEKN